MSVLFPDTAVDPGGLADHFDPLPDPYASNPDGWIRERLGEWVWSKQQEICVSVRDNRFTTVRSAHGTGKSYIAGRLAAWWLDVHPVGEAFVVTSAPTDKQVKAILWREIGRAHRKAQLKGRINLDAEWYIGQELVAYGRKPADYTDDNRAREAFQGIHAKYVLVILDEACGIPTWLWEAADSLVTNDLSRILAIGNPDDPATEFERTQRPGSEWNAIHISAFDLPCYTGEYVPDFLLDVLTGKTWVEERLRKWGEGSPLYTSKVLGEFPEITEDTLITPAMIRKAFEAEHLPGLEAGRLGVDVARYGKDETAVYRNRGGVVREEAVWGKKDTMETAGKIAKILKVHKREVPATIDTIGVGGGVYDRLRELGHRVVSFNASERARQPTKFKNRRAEAYWALREHFEDNAVDLDERDLELASELQMIKWYVDSSGRIYIEPKEETAKRLGRSPDRADAAMMSFVNEGEWASALGVDGRTAERDRKAARTKEVTHGLLEEPI